LPPLFSCCSAATAERGARRSHHSHGADRFGGDLGRDAAQKRAHHRILARADHDMIDLIDRGEFQDRGCRIDRFQHMHREPALIEF
jgi:hypothetical protein